MALFRFLLVAIVPLFCACQVVAQASGQVTFASESDQISEQIEDVYVTPAQTESPRSTLRSLYRLRDDLEASLDTYRQQQNSTNAARTKFVMAQIRSLIDLSKVSLASRRETGSETVLYLLDILGRVKPIDSSALPGTDDIDGLADPGVRLPGTPLRIIEIAEGGRAGEHLFSAGTIRSAPRFFDGLKTLPLRSTLPITSWHNLGRQLTGPWIPITIVAKLPDFLKNPLFDTPVWKILLVALLSIATGVVLRIWHKFLVERLAKNPVKRIQLNPLSPVAIIIAMFWLHYVFSFQVNTFGRFFNFAEASLVVVRYVACTWAFWAISRAVFETIINGSKRPVHSLDNSFIRLVGQIIGVIGGILILGYGAYQLGVPVVSMTAGLGIGGIAVALAIRPTLENLIGGFILFLDKPVQVGDYCTFGDQSGTVDSIGVRSTQLRSLDRTLLSIPNAQLADMQIINWAKCDTMLIRETLGLRFETDTEQLRHVLAKIREMLHSHPRIEPETIRVRFIGYGDSSLNVDLRIYATTQEWNDFYSIREDVLLRIGEIVDASGSGFAFPSQTIYWGRDSGLDTERTEKAHQEVAAWRKRRELPFPRFSSAALETLSGKIRYPPPGSPHSSSTGEELAEGDETLSAVDPQQPVPNTTSDEKPDKSSD